LAEQAEVAEPIVAHVAGVDKLENVAADYFEKLKTRLENKINQIKVKPVKES
jgi:predicted small metal-binding protein